MAEEEKLVYYVSYGSNLRRERLDIYINGGKLPSMLASAAAYPGCGNRAPPRAALNVRLPHRLRYRLESPTWGGGVCFLDYDEALTDRGVRVVSPSPSAAAAASASAAAAAAASERDAVANAAAKENAAAAAPALAWGRAWLVTASQFEEIVLQENAWRGGAVPPAFAAAFARCHTLQANETIEVPTGWYNVLLCLGEIDGVKLFTFSTTRDALRQRAALNHPSPAYTTVILKGLKEMGAIDDKDEAVAYFAAHFHFENDAHRSAVLRNLNAIAASIF